MSDQDQNSLDNNHYCLANEINDAALISNFAGEWIDNE